MGPATWGACVRQLPRRRRLIWALGLGLAVVALFPLLLVAQVTATSAATTSWNVGSAPTPAALEDIPPDYLALYQAAARTCEGLGWGILAGIGKVESDHGRSPLAGVHSGANADVYDPADAIFAAARLLCANGAGDPRTLEDAVWAYNHSTAYYRQVIAWAARYVKAAGACGEAAAGAPSPAAAGAVCFALAQLGKPYLWGGTGPDRFDCSGLTMMAYRSVGVAIPRTSAAQFRGLPAKVPVTALLPGDLVFYATDLTDPATIHHVGMVIMGGRMIEAPYTGASIRIRPWDRPDLIGAVRPAG
jgi:cell wall-associated NlpC family hydrolase